MLDKLSALLKRRNKRSSSPTAPATSTAAASSGEAQLDTGHTHTPRPKFFFTSSQSKRKKKDRGRVDGKGGDLWTTGDDRSAMTGTGATDAMLGPLATYEGLGTMTRGAAAATARGNERVSDDQRRGHPSLQRVSKELGIGGGAGRVKVKRTDLPPRRSIAIRTGTVRGPKPNPGNAAGGGDALGLAGGNNANATTADENPAKVTTNDSTALLPIGDTTASPGPNGRPSLFSLRPSSALEPAASAPPTSSHIQAALAMDNSTFGRKSGGAVAAFLSNMEGTGETEGGGDGGERDVIVTDGERVVEVVTRPADVTDPVDGESKYPRSPLDYMSFSLILYRFRQCAAPPPLPYILTLNRDPDAPSITSRVLQSWSPTTPSPPSSPVSREEKWLDEDMMSVTESVLSDYYFSESDDEGEGGWNRGRRGSVPVIGTFERTAERRGSVAGLGRKKSVRGVASVPELRPHLATPPPTPTPKSRIPVPVTARGVESLTPAQQPAPVPASGPSTPTPAAIVVTRPAPAFTCARPVGVEKERQ
ncbi:hypothetical protein HK104_010192 [Borealophlyctis nickersoniae]|nr:hypothetical protein HK104_010192 [Borealophlyctis nickersoniae]